MNGIELLVDTNILISLSEGKRGLDEHLQGNILYASIISEIELLGWHRISEKEKKFLANLLSELKIVELSLEVKNIAINIKQKNRIRLPDAIIAATSIHLGVPLLTFDSDFQKIQNLNLLLLDN